MKRIVIALLIASFFTGCHSGKKKSSKHFSKRSHYSARVQNSGSESSASSSNVSRINSAEADETQTSQPITRLDSLLGNTGGGYHNTDRTNFQGASGAGTGSSFASGAYAAAKKKKPKKKR